MGLNQAPIPKGTASAFIILLIFLQVNFVIMTLFETDKRSSGVLTTMCVGATYTVMPYTAYAKTQGFYAVWDTNIRLERVNRNSAQLIYEMPVLQLLCGSKHNCTSTLKQLVLISASFFFLQIFS